MDAEERLAAMLMGVCVWQRSAPRGQRGLVCVRVCVSSVSLSRPPSQVINVNAFSLRLTQMGTDARSRVHTHTHIDLSLTGQFYLSSGGWAGWGKESCESVWIQWSSACLEKHVKWLKDRNNPHQLPPTQCAVHHKTPALAETWCPHASPLSPTSHAAQEQMEVSFKDQIKNLPKAFCLSTQNSIGVQEIINCYFSTKSAFNNDFQPT